MARARTTSADCTASCRDRGSSQGAPAGRSSPRAPHINATVILREKRPQDSGAHCVPPSQESRAVQSLCLAASGLHPSLR